MNVDRSKFYSVSRKYGSNIPFNCAGYMVIEMNRLGDDGRRLRYQVEKLDGSFFILSGPYIQPGGVRVKGWVDAQNYLNNLV